MKKLMPLFGLVCLFLFPADLDAQNLRQGKTTEHPKLEAQAKQETNELMQELGLTTKQAVLVEKKLVEFLIYKKQLTSIENISKEDLEARMEVLNNNKLSELREILTDIQYERYIEIK